MISRTAMRRRLRRAAMGLSTLAGRPRGLFSPYRHAAGIVRPRGYPELERVFAAAEPEIARVLDAIERHGARLAAFDGPPPAPRWSQSWFPRLDGAAAHALVHERRPRRIVEVGSGHSTRILARAAAEAGGAEITCIDPAPRADIAALPVTLHRRVLCEADLPRFAALEAGDIAFLDSSHLLWPGSDVDMALNRVLPALAPGVLLHLHDILLPDPYPPDWDWRGYTEQLGLGGWLAGGGTRIVFASHYAVTRMDAARRPAIAALPLPPGARETSLWLERT
jgi:predicted O-methyltransferase YrrM